MAPCITELTRFLIELDTHQYRFLPWRGQTCLAVVCYVLKHCDDDDDDICFSHTNDHVVLLHGIIKHLNELATEFRNLLLAGSMESLVNLTKDVSQLLVNAFVPGVRNFFICPERYELLPGFIHFLLQIWDAEINLDKLEVTPSEDGSGYMLLTFILSMLGDTPFQHTELEQVQNMLAEFKEIANELGNWTYSNIFLDGPVEMWPTDNSISLYIKIANFLAEQPTSATVTPNKHITIMPDSLYIVDSLLVDLDKLMKNQHAKLVDDLEDLITLVHLQLTLARPVIKQVNQRDHKRVIHQEVKEFVNQVRDVAYEAEYLINSYVVGNFPIGYFELRLRQVIHKLVLICNDLYQINDFEVLRISEDMATSLLLDDSAESLQLQLADHNIFVGFEKDFEEILHDLTGEPQKLNMISVVGMPGLGKTTLARKLYNDPLVVEHFHLRAWCVVSQAYQKKKVMIGILKSLKLVQERFLTLQEHSQIEEKLSKMEENSLTQEIYQSLIGRRYLIVIDDVWDSSTWEDLGRYFPNGSEGSRILFTSRNRGAVPTASKIHSLSNLTREQSWELFEKKVFHGSSCPAELQLIGEQIAAKCNGLPLALVVIAGVLTNMDKNTNEWEKVQRNLESYAEDCMKILELSYECLPDNLKLCFMYIGTFPEDAEVEVEKLKRLWIVEGFIQIEERENLEDVAKDYMIELIERSLILSVDDEHIRIHDLLHAMCLKIAQDVNFLSVIKDNSFSRYEKQRRLRIHSNTPEHLRTVGLHCRSFFGYISGASSSLPQMKLVRVMELHGNKDVEIDYELKRVEMLVNLKYLVADRMPKLTPGSLVNLEYLCIESKSYDVVVPSVILTLVNLKHLYVNFRGVFDKDCDRFQTNNLETLSTIGIGSSEDLDILKCSPHLRKLQCVCVSVVPDFGFFPELETLVLGMDKDHWRSNIGYQNNIHIMEINFPSKIKKLVLNNTRLSVDEARIVGRLPKLEFLYLGAEAFDGKEWKTSDGEFQELRILRLAGLKVEQWITSSEHFPKLCQLWMKDCDELQSIPTELGDIPTLGMIEVYECSYEASVCAYQIEQVQRGYGNRHLIIAITNTEFSMEQLLLGYRQCMNQEEEEEEED